MSRSNGAYLQPADCTGSGVELVSLPLGEASGGRLPLYSLQLGGQELLRSVIFRFQAAELGREVYAVAEHAAPENPGLREILLMGPSGRQSLSGGFGKFTAPCLAAQEGSLYVCYEDRTGDAQRHLRRSRLLVKRLSPDLSETEDIPVVSIGCREYAPFLCPSPEGLLLVSEAFCGGRYRLLARVLEEGVFGPPAEVGTAADNDQGAAVVYADGAFTLAFENSQCLTRGYVYPLFPGVIIPSFGHGWRINTKLQTRRLRIRDGRVEASPCEALSRVKTLSDGACSLCAAGGREVLAFQQFRPDKGRYAPVVYIRGAAGWEPLYEGGALSAERKPVTLRPDGEGGVFLSCLLREEEGVVLESQRLSVPSDSPAAAPAGGFSSCHCPPPSEPEQAPPVLELAGHSYRLFAGDLHMHSNISPCSLHYGFHCSEIEDKYRLCADLAGLQFAMCTDHDWMDERDWARSCAAAEFANQPEVFTAFIGYEWTSSQYKDGLGNYGHRNVLYRDSGPLLRCRGSHADSPEGLWAQLTPGEALTIPHHTGDAAHPFDWNHYHPDFDREAEIFNVRGSYEYDGCDMYPLEYGRQVAEGRCLDAGLKQGYRLGFTSGGEHEGCGVTLLPADELNRHSLFDALFQRRVYGLSGERMKLSYTAGDVPMGGSVRLPAGSPLVLRLRAETDVPLAWVRLMKDSRLLREWTGLSDPVWETEAVLEAQAGYYYFTVRRQDGEMGWVSPIWVETETA